VGNLQFRLTAGVVLGPAKYGADYVICLRVAVLLRLLRRHVRPSPCDNPRDLCENAERMMLLIK